MVTNVAYEIAALNKSSNLATNDTSYSELRNVRDLHMNTVKNNTYSNSVTEENASYSMLLTNHTLSSNNTDATAGGKGIATEKNEAYGALTATNNA